MSGVLVKIADLLQYSSNLQSNQTSIIPIGPRAISCIDFPSGNLQIRLTQMSLQSTSSVEVGLWNSLVSTDFPQQVIYDADAAFTSGNAVTFKSFTSTTAPIPRLLTANFNLTAGASLGVIVKIIQGATAGANSFTIGVDVILRDAH